MITYFAYALESNATSSNFHLVMYNKHMQNEGQTDQEAQPQAGWVFTPGGAPQPAAKEAEVTSTSLADPSLQNSPSDTAPQEQKATPKNSLVTWTASEYVGTQKTTSWFAMLAAATVSLAVIVYFLTSDVVSVVVIVILGVIIGVFAARQPQVLEYNLDHSGIYVGQRFYPYNYFKTFSVVEDGAFSHISLLSLKRFMPPLAVHYSPNDEDKIIKTLADYLPYEEHKRDVIENFTRRVRF